MRTPERAVWPLPPRPAVLPLPEPMPRPTRMRFLREPALSAISLSFIVRFLLSFRRPRVTALPLSLEVRGPSPSLEGRWLSSQEGRYPRPPQDDVNLFLVDDTDEMLNLCDHAANCRGVLQLGDAADLVELEADQRLALRVMAADRAAGLLDLDHLCGLGHRHKLQIASLVWHDLFGKPEI